MPVKYLMGWDKQRQRWQKMVNGKRLFVSPRTLKKLGYLAQAESETKESSRQAANEWLQDQLGKIVQPTIEERKIAWAKRHDPSMIAQIQQSHHDRQIDIDHVKDDRHEDCEQLDSVASRAIEALTALGVSLEGIDARTLNAILGETGIWRDRLSRDDETTVETNSDYKTIYFDGLESRVKAKLLSLSQYDLCKSCVNTFSKWMGDERINASHWDKWYHYLLIQERSNEWRKKHWMNARNYVEFLVEQGQVEPFLSLRSKRYKFVQVGKVVVTPESGVIRKVIDKAEGRLRLLLLLMANCGFTQKDVSDLTIHEYDEFNGTITRKRSKTRKLNTRTVVYRLWPETLVLLEEYKSRTGDRLFLTETGKPWVVDELREGKRSKSDNAAVRYRKLKAGISLKQFRQASGDKIKHKFGQGLADVFLGHGKGVVEGSYFTDGQSKLDEAILWLRVEYGFSKN